MLVERFVRAVCERGLALESVLVITYTERAAGELRARIRERLVELDRDDLARDIDRAWISTIHGFCSRLLRSHPFEAGLDPGFRVLDESQSRVLRSEAFTEALARFCAGREPDRLALLATYGSDRLAAMLGGVYERLRSAGRALELGARRDGRRSPTRSTALAECAPRACSTAAPRAEARAHAERALELPGRADELLDLERAAARRADDALASFADALAAVESAALDEIAARDRELLQELLRGVRRRLRARRRRASRRSTSRISSSSPATCSCASEAVREQAQWRFRSVLVDEFQDTNRLQCELVDALACEELFFVGDEFQSIYRFRHADVDVFRERREQRGGVLALTQNYRSRPEILAVVNHVFGTEFGTDVRAARRRRPLPRAALRARRRAARHGQGGVQGERDALARGRGAARRAPRAGARGRGRGARRARSCSSSRPARTPSATRRRCAPRACRRTARPGAATSASSRSPTSSRYLRLLQNRYDDEALVTVLASPFVGVSNDGLVLLRRAAGRRPLFAGLERELPGDARRRATAGSTRRSASATSGSCARASASGSSGSASRSSSSTTTTSPSSRSGTAGGATRTSASSPGSRARTSRCAARTSRASSASSATRRRPGAREVEAAVGGGGRATRCGSSRCTRRRGSSSRWSCSRTRAACRPRPRRTRSSCLPDGRFGFRVVNPATGRREPVVRLGRDARGGADGRPGREPAAPLRGDDAGDRPPDRLRRVDPTSRRDAGAPLHWILERLEVERRTATSRSSSSAATRGCSLRVDRPAPRRRRGARADAVPQLQLFAPDGRRARPAPAPELPALRPPFPRPRAFVLRRLSYSALALFDRCSYRFYARADRRTPAAPTVRVQSRAGRRASPRPRSATPSTCSSRSRRRPEEVRDRVLGRYPAATEDDLARIESLVAAWHGSELARRLAASEDARPELGFAFAHDGVLVRGRFDVFRLDEGRGRSSSTTRRTASRRRRRRRWSRSSTGSSGSCTRSPRSAPGRRRSRSSTCSSSARPSRCARRSRRDDVAGLEAELSDGDPGDPRGRLPADAERVRVRRLSRRSTSSAPGRGCSP